MKLPNRFTLTLVLCCFAFSSNSQVINDFRSISDGTWNTIGIWQKFDGADWVAATYYPGNGVTNDVAVNHTITGNVVINNISNLTISGSLTIGTSNMTVGGSTTISGSFTDNSNTGVTNFVGNVSLIGTGTFTTTAVTTNGNMIFGGNFEHTSSGTSMVGTATINGSLVVSSGIFQKNATGTLTVTGTTNVSNNGQISLTNNSPCVFIGTITMNNSSAWTSTAVTTAGNMVLRNGLTQNSSGALAFGIAAFNTNSQTISIANNTGNVTFANAVSIGANLTIQNSGDGTGVGIFRFIAVATIADNIVVTNRRKVIALNINGATSNSEWINDIDSEVEIRDTPFMGTGKLTATANGNIVKYSRVGGDQVVKFTNYWNLELSSGGTLVYKRFANVAGSITIHGNVTIGTNAALEFNNNATPQEQEVIVKGNVTIATSGRLATTTNANVAHSLTLEGNLINNGTVVLQSTAARYCDLTMTASGEIIRGTAGSITLRNLILTSDDAKTCSYAGNISFYGGAGSNSFTNNGGSFTATTGTFQFLDAAQFSIAGTGAVSFNNLVSGNNNASILTLEREVAVNGLLTINHSSAGYIALNDQTLNLNGNITRTNSGQFRGTAGSTLNLGNGNTVTATSNFSFQTDYQVLAALNHNTSASTFYYTLVSTLSVPNLNVTSGELRSTGAITVNDLSISNGAGLTTSGNLTSTNTWVNNGNYTQTAGTTTFDKTGGTIAIDGVGTNTYFSFEILDATSVSTALDLSINGNLINSSNALSSFNQTAGTTTFSINAAQSIQGTGTGEVSFNNLTLAGGNTKTINHSFAVKENLQVNNGVTLQFGTTGDRSIIAKNVIIGQGASGTFNVAAFAGRYHSLAISGELLVNAGATFNMRNSATAYCDLTFTGNGEIIKGSATTLTVRNITLSGGAAKTSTFTGNIDFYGGSGANDFTNDNGSFTASEGTFRFLEPSGFTISGTGSIAFNNLSLGNANTQFRLTLNRNVTVNGLFYLQSSATGYLDLNGYTLDIYGNFNRQNTGQFRGSATSILNLGNGNTPTITNSILFDATAAELAALNHNVTNGYTLGSNLTLGNLTVSNGTLTTALNLSVSGDVTNNATINQTAGTTTFTGADSYIKTTGGTPSTTFFTVTVANDSKVTNQVEVTISNLLNGSNANSTWVNDDNSTLNYNGTPAMPMATGSFDVNQTGNTVNYVRNAAQTIHPTTYHNLTSSGGNTKTLGGDLTVESTLHFSAGTISIGANTLTLRGPVTGSILFTGGASSNLTIEDAGAMPSFSLPAVTLNTLSLNRASGISLGGAITVTNLALSNGLISLGSNNLIATNIAGHSASGYVVATGTGTLRRVVGASDVVFPVGTLTSYLPLTLNNAGTSDTYYVSLFDMVTDNGSSGGNAITDNVVNATWVVSEAVAGGSNLTVTAQWNEGNEGVDFDRTNSMVAYYSGGAWSKTAPSAAGGANPFTQQRSVGAIVGSFAVVDQLFLGVPGLWSGNVSSDWHTPGNWTDYSIPNGTVDVTLPVGRSNYPILTGTVACNNLTIEAGASLDASTATFTVNGSTSIEGAFTDGSNTGVTTFVGLVTLSGTGTFTSTSVTTVANMVFQNGITNNSTGAFNAGATTFGANSQAISGTGSISFAAVTIANNIEVTNQTTVSISGVLNGGNASSKWINDDNTTLNYSSATQPMAIGDFDVNQTGSTVNYSGAGQGVKITDYYNLISSGTGTKTLSTNGSFSVLNNLSIASGTAISAANINGEGVLTVDGVITNDGTLTLWITTARYMDLLLTNSGTILTGSGAFNLANLTLSNAGAKICDVTGIISFNGGNTVSRSNQFTNNGTFTATQGLIRFIHASTFNINGTGSITFNNFQSGNNTASILILNRDITIGGTLTINHSSGYISLNNNTINVFGNISRSNNGQFRGTASSTVNLGNGNTVSTTSNLAFESGFQVLGSLNVNTAASTLYYTLASPLTVSNLNISSGQLNNGQNLTITNSWTNEGTYNQTNNTTFFNKTGGGTISIAGDGFHTFWNLEVSDGTTVTTSKDIYIQNNFVSSSNEATAFNQSDGTTHFNRNAAQGLSGAGSGTVSFYNLTASAGNVKTIDLDIDVKETTTVSNGVTLRIGTTANRTLTFKNITVGQGSSGAFDVAASADRRHSLIISNLLTVNSGATFYMRNSATSYCDVTMSGAGTIVQGLGLIRFRNLTLTNPAAKNFNTTATVRFYPGSFNANSFTNNGGDFTAPSTNMLFRETTTWLIEGSGNIYFGTLQVGENTATIVRMNKDITVDHNLIFNLNAATYYLELNGNNLTLNGNHTRVNNGRIRGGGSSSLTINGTGNFTSTYAFDQTALGSTNLLNSLIFNRGGDGMMQLANVVEINTFNLNQGVFNAGGGSIVVNGVASINSGSFIDNANGGYNSFLGTLTIAEPASFNPTANSVLNLGGTITNNGNFIKEGTGNTTFVGNATLAGDSAIFLMNGPILIDDGISVVNNISKSGSSGVYMFGRLNGSGVGSQWDNRGILTYLNGSEPMTTGTLTATFNPNTVIYARNLTNQDIKSTTYHHLQLVNGSTRTMYGPITVNGNLLIGEENILVAREHQITGNASGTLTMLEISELRIGRDVVASTNGFPSGFIRENIILDPTSLVSYAGQVQPVSHVPVYENLSITEGGNKTITGDVTINGYMRMTAGTFVFGDAVKRTVTIYGDLYASGGRINMASTGDALTHELVLWGASNQANRFSNAINSIVTYASTGIQQIFAPTGGDWYGILEIAGGSTKFLEGSVQLRKELRITSGIIRLEDFDLNLYSDATNLTTVTGSFSNTNMVETNGSGRLVRQSSNNSSVNIQGLYPIGSNGRYAPFTINSITFTGAVTRSLGVKTIPERHPSIPYTYDALLRYWDISTTNITSITAANANFQFSPLDVIGDDTKFKVYRWNGSEFVEQAGSSIAANTMLAPNALPLTGVWTSYDEETIRETLYSYKDGDWNDPDTWTTDPSGQLLENPRVPVNSDNVVILSGKTVELTQDLDTRGLIIEVNEGGILDLGAFAFNEVVSILDGKGTLKLATNQMPQVALNKIVEPEGGTVEYNVPDVSFNLNNQAYYNNLTINLPNASNKAILLNNLLVYNDLKIDKGVFQVFSDDPTSTIYSTLTIDISGDVIVDEEGSIIIGTASTNNGTLPPTGTTPGRPVPRYYDIYHLINIEGSLQNNGGSVRFVSNDINSFDFSSLSTRGAATVRFHGTNSTEIICNGTTDFYNLIIDKGNGPSVEHIINTSAPERFRLFGCNSYSVPADNANPELRKALWIRNGTLRLKGMTTIPSLTEGGSLALQSSWYIPANAALILDDRDVTVLITADGNNEVTAVWNLSSTGVFHNLALSRAEELRLYGKLEINDGYLSTRMSGGIIYPGTSGGELIMNGGKLSTRQIRSGGTGNALLAVNGGEIEMLGGFQYNTSTISNFEQLRTPTINTTHSAYRLDGNGTLYMASTNNMVFFNGGEVNIYNTSGGGGSSVVRINSSSNNITSTGGEINVEVIRNTPYDFYCLNGWLPSISINRNASTGNTARLLSNIRINGDLVLTNYGAINANTNNYNLTVNGDFIIGANSTYNPQQNVTIFSGEEDKAFTVNGTITSNIYSLTVNKPNASLTMDGSNGSITVRADLTISNGTFNDGGKTITAMGSIYNSSTHVGTGKIRMASGLTNREIGGNGLGQFENLELNEAVDIISTLTANQTVNGVMTMTSGPLNLDTYKLRINGSLSPNTSSSYSSQTLFFTAGNASDGGLELFVNGNGNYLFPVSTRKDGINRFTPAVASVSGFIDDGYIQLNPVAIELPTLSQDNPGDALQYYWKVRQDGFDDVPQASWLLTYDENDVDGDEGLYIPGRVEVSTRIWEPSGVNTTENTITFPSHNVTRADYTAAKEERFTGPVREFYNIVLTGGNWDDPIWSEEGHAGAVSPNTPGAGDIVYITNSGLNNSNHFITVNSDLGAAELIFSYSGSGWPARLLLDPGVTATFDEVHGVGGEIGFTFNDETDMPQLLGDIADFSSNTSNTILFIPLTDSPTSVVLPSNLISFPSVRIQGPGGLGNTSQRIVSFPVDITILGDLRVDNNSTLRIYDQDYGNISVSGNLYIGPEGRGGKLEFPTEGITKTVTVFGDVFVGGNADNNGEDSEILILNTTPTNALHELQIHGNISLSRNGKINLFTDNSGGNNVLLSVRNAQDNTLSRSESIGVQDVNLYRVVLNKGVSQANSFSFDAPFTLNAPVDIATKSLVLQNGTAILNYSSIDIELTAGGGAFQIPTTTGLIIKQGRVFIDAQASIILMGKLRVENIGEVRMGQGNNDNTRIIQYQGTVAELEIADNGVVEVNSQIRRPTSTLAGALRFRQTGGELIIHGRDPNQGRAKLEVTNTGSEFTMTGGTITIRRGAGTTFGDLYLRPASSNVTGGEIIFSQGTSVNSNQTYRLDANISLANLTIAGWPANNRRATVILMNNPLEVNSLFKFGNALVTLNTNDQDVTLRGNLEFNGIWLYGTTDSVMFKGNVQTISGSPTFNHMRVNPTTSLSLLGSSGITVEGTLHLLSGQLIDGENAIVVKKDLINEATHVSTNPSITTSGIKLNGATNQKISGAGQFGLLELDNTMGATLLNGINLNNNLILTRGLLNIGNQLLELGLGSEISSGLPFSSENMILTDGVFSLNSGIKKIISSGASSFTFPFGVAGKYTPIELSFSDNSTQGYIIAKPVNQYHPTALVPDNVLQYYWYFESDGISNLTGDIVFNYVQSDVRGDDANYWGAKLFEGNWLKYEDAVDSDANSITFSYVSAAPNDINGEYSAGNEDAFSDEILTYTSTNSGVWNDANNWTRSDSGVVPPAGPSGAKVIILPEHTISANGNKRNAYSITINGRLDVGSSYGHNFGAVDGTGTFSIDIATLPAGRFDNFFSCSGGTMEYGGALNFTITDKYHTYRNLTIKGTGRKQLPVITELPNNRITICNNLSIEDEATLQSRANQFIYVGGNISKAVNAKTDFDFSSQRVIMNGTVQQIITGTYPALKNRFWRLEVSNNLGVSVSGQISIGSVLYLTNGILSSVNNVNVTNESGITGGSAASFVAGPLRRLLANGAGTHAFPVGKAATYKATSIIAPSGASNSYWTVEYMNQNPGNHGYDPLKAESDLSQVSATEFWTIQGPNSYTGRLRFTLTGTSDVADVINSLTDLRIVRWNPDALPEARWEIVGGLVTISGIKTSGTVTCNDPIIFNGTPQIYSIGSIQPATAEFTGGTATICQGTSTNLEVTFEGTAPFSITYTANGGAPTTVSGINDNPYLLSVSPSVNTTYELTAMTHAYGNGVIEGGPITITVRPRPNVTISVTSPICDGGTTDLTLTLTAGTAPFDFTLSVNGTPDAPVENVNSPHTIFNYGPLSWSGSEIYFDYQIQVVSVTDDYGCTNNFSVDPIPEDTVRVYKLPETGPQYHIPNSFDY